MTIRQKILRKRKLSIRYYYRDKGTLTFIIGVLAGFILGGIIL